MVCETFGAHFAFNYCGCLNRSVYSTVQSPKYFFSAEKSLNLSIHHIIIFSMMTIVYPEM